MCKTGVRFLTSATSASQPARVPMSAWMYSQLPGPAFVRRSETCRSDSISTVSTER